MLREKDQKVNGSENPLAKLKHFHSLGSPCPAFDTLLDMTIGSDDDFRRYFFELIGYMMTPNKNIPVALVWIGDEQSGRGQVTKVIKQLIGSDNILESDAKMLFGLRSSAPYTARAVKGKLLVIDDDVSPNTMLDGRMLKKFSSATTTDVGSHSLTTYTTPFFGMDGDNIKFRNMPCDFERCLHVIYFENKIDCELADALVDIVISGDASALADRAMNHFLAIERSKTPGANRC